MQINNNCYSQFPMYDKSFIMDKLWIFMHFYNFMNITKEVEPKQKVSCTKYCNKYFTLNVLYMFACYMCCVDFCSFTFPIKICSLIINI